MPSDRDKAIAIYREIEALTSWDGYYKLEMEFLAVVGDDVLVLDDGEKCVFEYDSGIAERKILK